MKSAIIEAHAEINTARPSYQNQAKISDSDDNNRQALIRKRYEKGELTIDQFQQEWEQAR